LLSTGQASGFQRKDLRIAFDAEAVVIHDGVPFSARVADVSRGGAALSAPLPPPKDATVTLELGSHALVARVAWRGGRRFGLHFETRLRASDVFLLTRQCRGTSAP